MYFQCVQEARNQELAVSHGRFLFNTYSSFCGACGDLILSWSQKNSEIKIVDKNRRLSEKLNGIESIQNEPVKIVQCNEYPRADKKNSNRFVRVDAGQHTLADNIIGMPNSDLLRDTATSKPGSCEIVLGRSPWFHNPHQATEDRHARLTADCFSALGFASCSLLHPFEVHQCGATEGPDAAFHFGVRHVAIPACAGPSNGDLCGGLDGGCGQRTVDLPTASLARLRAASLGPIYAPPTPPPPSDDPFHGDWPHW